MTFQIKKHDINIYLYQQDAKDLYLIIILICVYI